MCNNNNRHHPDDSSLTTSRTSMFDAIYKETKLLLDLAVPTAVVELSTTIPPALTASVVGRLLGSRYLNGFTLATLTGNLLSLSLLFGLYTAADTLSPQVFSSGNFSQVGLLAMRGYIVGMILILPINVILWNWMHLFLIRMHQDVTSSELASQWFRIYIWGIPFYALFVVTWKFLSAQAVMSPLVISSLVACAVILPLSLEVFVSLFQFRGSAMAIVAYQFFQALFLVWLLWYKKPYHAETWPGLSRDSVTRALEWKQVVVYLKLGCGGILSMSEWWFWEVVALMIGTFGVLPLSVHTIPTQVIMVAWMVPLSVGIALAVRLGTILPHSAKRAQQVCLWTHLVSNALFLVLCQIMYTQRQIIFQWFTKESDIIQGCEKIWLYVVVFMFLLCNYGINMGTAFALGMQWTLGVVTTFFFWVVGLPCMYYFASVKQGGITAAWFWMSPPYLAMNVVLWVAFLTADWCQIQSDIRKREGLGEDKEEPTLLTHYGSIEIGNEDARKLLGNNERAEKEKRFENC